MRDEFVNFANVSPAERDPEADLALCEAAVAPLPLEWSLAASHARGNAEYAVRNMALDALPYWIRRAVAAERRVEDLEAELLVATRYRL
jgi:hypothetical protein